MDRVAELIAGVKELSNEDYMRFMQKALDDDRPPAVQKSVVKRIRRKGGQNAVNRGENWKGIPDQGNAAGYPNQPVPCTSREASKAATKAPFIYRSDLIPDGGMLFMDVEKLSLKKKTANDKHQQVASQLGVVNEDRDLVLWSYIKWDEGEVCQMFPKITGITKDKLENGLPLAKVTDFAHMAFKGNVVVGWDLQNDLKSIRVNHFNYLDISEYFVDEEGRKYRLKDAYFHFFEKNIQCGVHSSINDARATRDLYFKYMELKENYPHFNDYQKENRRTILRSEASHYAYDPSDVCRCPKKSKRNKKASKQSVFYVPAKN